MKNIFSRLTSRKPAHNEPAPRDNATEAAYAHQMTQIRSLLDLCLDEIAEPVPAMAS